MMRMWYPSHRNRCKNPKPLFLPKINSLLFLFSRVNAGGVLVLRLCLLYWLLILLLKLLLFTLYVSVDFGTRQKIQQAIKGTPVLLQVGGNGSYDNNDECNGEVLIVDRMQQQDR